MERKIKLIIFLTVIAIAVTLTCIPAMAAGLKWTKTIVNWHVSGVDEIIVTILGSANWNVTSSTGNTTVEQLNFTCSIKDCQWVNASLEGGATTQNQNTPALTIQNLGTTTATWINISSNYTWSGSDCFDWYYVNTSASTLPSVPTIASTQNFGTTNVTLIGTGGANATFAPLQTSIKIWLFGNFSNCVTQNNQTNFYVFSYT